MVGAASAVPTPANLDAPRAAAFTQSYATALFALRDRAGLADPLAWAERHAKVIRLFGRFPHRNAVLGRESTPEEIAFLGTPGSRF